MFQIGRELKKYCCSNVTYLHVFLGYIKRGKSLRIIGVTIFFRIRKTKYHTKEANKVTVKCYSTDL